MNSANASDLFEETVRSLKGAGYYHVRREDTSGQLIAAYTPNADALSQLKDEQFRSEHDTRTGRYAEFDLVMSGWESETCVAWVIRQPEGARSPAKIFHSGKICREFPSGNKKDILSIGKLVLDAWFF